MQVFVYLAGLQLLLTSGRKSVLVMVASTLASVLYRLNFCGVRRLRVSRLSWVVPHASHSGHSAWSSICQANASRLASSLCLSRVSTQHTKQLQPAPDLQPAAAQLHVHNAHNSLLCVLLSLQIPGPVVSAASKLLGPLLCDQQSTSIVMASSNAAQGGPAAAGGLYAPAAGIRQPPSRAAAAVEPSPSHINTLVAMGFSRDQAMQALQQTGNDVQTAIALLVGGH